jgi:peptide/nickel transport system substrate-binding protein
MIERLPLEWVRQVKDGKIKGITLIEAPAAAWRRLMFNVADPPFNNKKLRQAVVHAMNKQEMIQAAYYGFGEPADQKYQKGHEWYAEGVRPLAFDLEKAKALVRESGHEGRPIKILIEQSQMREAEALTLQSQLKKIGLNVELEVVDRGAFLNRQTRGEFNMVTEGGESHPDPAATYGPYFSCAKDPRKRPVNRTGYCDKEMDGLLEKLESELNANKRKALLRQIITKLHDDVPEVAIAFVPRYFALHGHVKGFVSDDEGRFRWWRGGLNYAWIDK